MDTVGGAAGDRARSEAPCSISRSDGGACCGAPARSPRRRWRRGPPRCAPDDDALTFFFAANPDEAAARMRVVDEFQRRHPDIKVRPVLSGPGVMQQMSTFCAGGKCPDVLMAWELTYAGLADRGVLLDLNTMLARDKAFAARAEGGQHRCAV